MRYRWELVLWLWLAFFFNQADRQIFSIVLPALRRDLGLTDVQLGLVMSLFTVALAVAAPIAGVLGDRLPRKRIVVLSLFGWSVATMCTGFGASLWSLLAIRSVATAAGEGCFAPSAFAMLSAEHQDTRARALSTFQTAAYTGLVASGWIGGAIADRFGWRAAFWIFGAVGIALAGALAARLRPQLPPATRRTPVGQTLAAIVSTPTARLAALGSGALIFVNIAYLSWMPTYLYERFGLSLTRAGLASMLFHHAAAFAGVIAAGWVSDAIGPRRPRIRLELQALALLAGAPCVWLLGAASTQSTLYVALAAFGFFRGAFDANTYPAFFAVIPSRYHATASGLLIAFAFVVASLAPVLLAEGKARIGLAGGFSMLALVYIAGACAMWWAAARHFASDSRRAQALEVA